jgi:hypothetical protein
MDNYGSSLFPGPFPLPFTPYSFPDISKDRKEKKRTLRQTNLFHNHADDLEL